MSANYNQRFGDQSQLLSNLNNVLTPISQAGPSQEGFSAGEKAALNTQAINSSGAAAKNAMQATQGRLAGRGGDSGLQSGVDQQILAGQASAAAGQLSEQQLKIQEANYAQGHQNWTQANQGLLALSGQYNPAAFGEQASAQNASAFKEADQIQQEKNQAQADIAGGITSLAMDAATFGVGAFAKDAAGKSGGFMGGLNALKG